MREKGKIESQFILVGFINMFPIPLGHPIALQAGVIPFGNIGGVEKNGEQILIRIIGAAFGKPGGFFVGEVVEVGVVQIIHQRIATAKIMNEKFLVREALAEMAC